ncbi:D-alanine--D-alanine ligase family protein [Lysinibacter cavernae]|uniref:D-alanine--D-alanine ligase n=1 Tax=Lysinibacter cavernae TaxID=1640652 RepID=A0A7X5TTW8_9MICO|nr:D-alanine--D-alanine ligase [Lysinibacter cavernae]NIH54640.1 D-alanine-D-alanine ligase [Lysinibacter cavernae]
MTNKAPLTIVVLAGGISHERDVSLRSGRRVAEALEAAGHTVIEKEPDAQLLPYLVANRPDVVWPALHGASGEDGALRSLLEALSIPFVGSSADAARRAWSKPVAKSIVAEAGVAIAPGIALAREAFRELGAASVLPVISEALGTPLVVKPSQGGSAQGVSVVDSPADLPRAMVDAYTYSDIALIEQRIIGTEVAVSIIELDGMTTPLPAVEIVPRSGLYSYEARYNAGETHFYTPARLSPRVTELVADQALLAHQTLGLSHLSRIDFIIDKTGVPVFLEATVMPGLTETSLLPLAAQNAGLTLAHVCSELAYDALSTDAVGDNESSLPLGSDG